MKYHNSILLQCKNLYSVWLKHRYFVYNGIKVISISFLLLSTCQELTQISSAQSIHFNRLNTSNGLSNNNVYDILQDKYGFIWLATEDGLNRFDGYEFRIFRHDPADKNSLSGNSIQSIIEDSRGNIWIGTTDGWLNRYDQVTEKFSKWKMISDRNEENIITCLYVDSEESIWIGTYRSGLYRLNQSSGKLDHWVSEAGDTNTLSHDYISSILEDCDGNIWAATYYGLNKFNPNSDEKTFTRYFRKPKQPQNITDNIYWALTKSNLDTNIFWVGTANGLLSYNTREKVFSELLISNPNNMQFGTAAGNVVEEIIDGDRILWIDSYAGLVRLNFKTNEKIRFVSKKNTLNSLSSNQIHKIIKDRSGVFWIATNNGLSYFSNKNLKFNNNFSNINKSINTEGLTGYNITAIVKTNDDRIWLGTNQGLYCAVPIKEKFNIQKLADSEKLNIWSLSSGNSNELWIGTYGSGLYKLNINNNELKHIPLFKDGLYPESIKFIKSLYTDKNNNLWLGFWGYGLAYYNTDTGKIKSWFKDLMNMNSLSHDDVWVLYQDTKGRLWIGTNGGGLNLFDSANERFYHWVPDANNPNSLSGNSIYSICESVSRSNIRNKNNDHVEVTTLWIGTNNGLNKFEIYNTPENALTSLETKITRFTISDGLNDNSIKSIVEDDNNNLWLGTSAGISFFNTRENKFSNYTAADGIIGTGFNFSSVLKGNDGFLYLGSNEGLNFFDPEKIEQSSFSPPVVLTDFQIFNKSVIVDRESPLTESLLHTKKIILPYSQNVFSFQFSAMDFSSPSSILYAYKMEGFDDDWVNIGSRRFVTYTNLNPGEYTFKVKSTNSDGIWTDNVRTVKVIITPPWWQTYWAIGLYILIFILGVWGIVRFQSNRTKLQHDLKMQEFESHHLREIESMKSRFFANLSHEFRTPLMLIKGPLEQLIHGRIKENRIEYYKMALRNTEKLQHLIDELLELSQLELEKIPLNLEKHNIVILLQSILSTFNPLAEQKNISFSFISSINELIVSLDKDKLEKIINNLLSNAFKFTASGGSVTVRLVVEHNDNKSTARIMISDSGIGISEEHQTKIFDRFYRVDDSSGKTHVGSGIGLALVKELVILHQWDIKVSSREGEETTFTLHIPLTGDELDTLKFISEEEASTTILPGVSSEEILTDEIEKDDLFNQTGNSKPIVLFVEDSEDVRTYVSDLLKTHYKLLIADNAKDGMELAINNIPDLILSDVMMPEVDGVEFCHRIKSNRQTSHIPVILLTAKVTDESKIEGLESGADDYMTKPFNYDELSIRIKNLIDQRKHLRDKFSKDINLKPDSLISNKLDKEYFERVLTSVYKNIDDPEFNTDQLAKELFVSRRQLHRKIIALTGHGPGEFIRATRLKKAAQMLIENKFSVTQIAYEVGFGSPAQFTRAFSKHFDCLPSEFKDKYKNQQGTKAK